MNREYWDFIHDNAKADTSGLRLTLGKKEMGFNFNDAVMQIDARRKARSKIPWFLAQREFRFPSLQAAEQASNQAVALYHAWIIGHGKRVADLTAGLGIDAMTVSLNGNTVDAFELDQHRAEILQENAVMLGLSGFNVHAADSIKFLDEHPDLRYDLLFIDPARRDASGNRIFRLQDSMPDVIGNMNLLLNHALTLMVKASPLLDITQTIRDLGDRKYDIQIVSYRGEVKEVLIIVSDTQYTESISVIDIADAHEFPAGDVVFNYRFELSGNDTSELSIVGKDEIVPGLYLYEAGAGIRKLHCSDILCGHFPGLKALSADSELFVSDRLYPDFPGRVDIIREILTGKDAKRLQGERIRVVASRYPVTADELRRKYGLREGDNMSLYATSISGGKKMLILTEREENSLQNR